MPAFSRLAPVLLLLAAAPASSSSGAAVPEASSTLLFALGLAGLLVGRSLSRRRRDGDGPRD